MVIYYINKARRIITTSLQYNQNLLSAGRLISPASDAASPELYGPCALNPGNASTSFNVSFKDSNVSYQLSINKIGAIFNIFSDLPRENSVIVL